MIVRDKPTFLQLAFIMRGSVLRQILPQTAAVSGIALLVAVLQNRGILHFNPVAAVALTVIGSAFAIFAAFRNAAAYDRWWEARKNIGFVVIHARNLSREARYYIAPGDDLPDRIARRCIAFVFAARDYLRDTTVGEDVANYVGHDELDVLFASQNPPNRLLDCFSADIAAALAAGRVSPIMAQMLENRVAALTDSFSCLRRTKTTPMPFVYTLLVHRTAYAFCFILPFGVVAASGYWTPLVTAIVAYTFFGLDAVGDELATPFTLASHNTVPLDAIARTFEIDILESLGETKLPEPLVPDRHVLT